MKNLLLILIVPIIMAGCKRKEKLNILPGNVNPPMPLVVDSSRYSGQTIFNSPFFYAGSGFGPTIICYARTRHWNLLLNMTSIVSRRKFGDQAILKMYKSLKINYQLKQASYYMVADTFYIRYSSKVYATEVFRDLKVDIEADSCRLVVDEVKKFLR